MKFMLKNIGAVRSSEMEFGNLTILTGRNNTGKTYVTYNTFNYIDAVRYFLKVPVGMEYATALLKTGKVTIPLKKFLEELDFYIHDSMQLWLSHEAHRQMAAHRDFYRGVEMDLSLDERATRRVIRTESPFITPVRLTQDTSLVVKKNAGDDAVSVMLNNTSDTLPDADVVSEALGRILTRFLLLAVPSLFIITCERTGAATFRTALLASRSIAGMHPDEATAAFSGTYRQMEFLGYPRPMSKDLEFVMSFEGITQRKSYLAEEHPEILEYFTQVVGGRYVMQEPDIVKFVPENSDVGLTAIESSSAVRSLMELNFYLKHIAEKGQCLVVDEPEFNLHPENQRKVARLLAMLVNAGVFVAITTHSDYMLREFDFMIRLAANPQLAEQLGYTSDQLINPAFVKTYVTQSVPDTGRYDVVEVPVTPDNGIESTSFDYSIDDMNVIQQAIQLGEVIDDPLDCGLIEDM